MHNRRSFLLGATAAGAALGLAACGGEGAGSGGPDPDADPSDLTVGVAMPTQQQIDQMITTGVAALLIASIDGASLSAQLDAAASAGIPVIA